jgi:plastocyanin domain-containing protein
MNRLFRGLILAALVAAPALSADWTENRFVAVTGEDGIQHVEIAGGSYFFAPNVVVVKVNIPVELVLRKVGGGSHDFILDAPEAGVDIDLPLSVEPKTVIFTPTKVGKYEFFCDHGFLFWTHKGRGMYGYLEVKE